MNGKRIIPTERKGKCFICRRPVELVETVEYMGLFDAGDGRNPHVCPPEAVERFRSNCSTPRMMIFGMEGRGDLPG